MSTTIKYTYLKQQTCLYRRNYPRDLQGVPVLSVHDSYIIDYTRVGELKAMMATASGEVVGSALPASNQFFGIDEMQGDKPGIIRDYIWWRQTPRSPGYMARLAAHEVRTGREVAPY